MKFKQGELNHCAILTAELVQEMRQMRRGGASYSQLADRFDVDRKHAWRICQRISWSWLTDD